VISGCHNTNSQERLTPNNIETILKQNHIFDNISLASKPKVIKVSPKSDMSIVWLDIWDVQSGSNMKMLINKCFNVGNYITTICGANMNPGVPQCKNCWKWGTLCFCAGFKEPDVSNAMACTSQNTIRNSVGAARPTTKSTHHDLRQKKGNPAPTHSSAQIVMATILPTLINACFSPTGSIGSGIRKNTLRSVKIGLNYSVLK